jgi:hypothetical protein
MRFLADVGVSPSIVAHLRSIGHDVESLVESSRHRLTDVEIYAIAAAQRRPPVPLVGRRGRFTGVGETVRGFFAAGGTVAPSPPPRLLFAFA